MATTRVCGFECGDSSTAHFGLSGAVLPEIVTSFKRSGSRACRILEPTNDSLIPFGLVGSTTCHVARIYAYFATLPSSSSMIGRLIAPAISPNYYGIAFHQPSGQLRAARLNPDTGFFTAASGPAINAGEWYALDVRVESNGSVVSVDIQVTDDEENVVAGAQFTHSNSALFDTGFSWMHSVDPVVDVYFDDARFANASGNYPIGPGSVNHFIPVSDGTHNVAGANQFERGGTGTDITNSTTDAYLLVDDIPLPQGVVAGDDYIKAVAPANATDYVECKFGPAPGISTPTDPPDCIDVLVSYQHEGLSAGNIRLALNDNGSIDDVVNVTSLSGGTAYLLASKHYSDPPSAAAAWTLSTGDGNFLNLRMRFYSSDANPDQNWHGAMIEADFPTAAPLPPPGGYYACAGTLPTFQTAEADKIDALRTLRATPNEPIEAYEMVKISWPAPDGDIYYAVLQTDEVASVAPSVTPIETRLLPDGNPNWFLPVQIDHSVGDEEVDLDFYDGDGVISDLLVDHGEGIKTELFYWFPQVDLLLPIWHGHLRQEDEAEIDRVKLKAVQGFRSSEGLLPRRAHYRECQAIFGGVLNTQAEIDEDDCPYNRHIGGAVGNLNSGSPYTSCPRRTRADCITRLSNNGNFMLSHATASVIVANNQTKGSRLFSASQGNETNLKDPVCVVMGVRRVRGMLVVAYRKDLNNNNPDNGFIFLIGELCEGPIESLSYAEVYFGSDSNPADPFNFNYRLGDKGQTAMDSALTVHSYSSTVLMRARSGWVDPEEVDISSVSGSAIIYGLNNIRVYTDATTYTEEWTDNRAWHILKMLTDKRWGYGYDYDRIDIPSFIEAACWCANFVRFTDDNGDTWDHIRSLCNVELRGRKVQQQIEDICLAGRLSRPFLFNGRIHIVPLRVMTAVELAAAPVFTDEGEGRNIIQEITDGVYRTTLKRERTSDLDLPNRIECTFDDEADDYVERPCRPVEDIDAQLAAGRVVGDHSRKINVKKFGLTGVVIEGQAIKMSTALRDLGPFDEGGLQNNLRLKFKIWFIDSLDLFPTKVIKVDSSVLTRYGFDYFRVISMKRMANLHVELTVQAYNATYMDAFEYLYGSIDPIPTDPNPPSSGSLTLPTDPLVFTSVSYAAGVLTIVSEAT